MARIKQLDPTPDVDFPGRDESISALHDILQSVHFNFEYEAQEGEVLDDDLLMDLTLQDMARQIVCHPDFNKIFPDYYKTVFIIDQDTTNRIKDRIDGGLACFPSSRAWCPLSCPDQKRSADPELEAFKARLDGTYKEKEYKEEEQILQELADLEAQAEFEAMQEAHDLHLAQQAAQDDAQWGL